MNKIYKLLMVGMIGISLFGCASMDRFGTDVKSDLNGGLNRIINVYTADGKIIASYEGRIDIETNDYVNNIAKTITKPKSANDSTGHEEYSFKRHGNIGIQTLAEVLQGSRRAVITIESELYAELQEYGLFFNIF